MLQNSKYWPFFVSSHSCLFEFVVNEDKIGDFERLRGNFRKIAENRVHFFLRISLLDHQKIIGPHEWRRIQIGQTLPISKLTNFLKIDAYMAILWPKENWTVFFLYFFGITQVKVENQLIFVKLLKNPQFLTKIHKVGLVWSATLISTDRISKNNKFQYFIVVRVEKYVSWARTGQPLC